MKRILLLLTLVCTVWGCSPRDSRLPRAKQSEIQLDESKADRIFYDVYKHLCEELHSMMIVKDGKVIYEKYATGHSAEERHVMWSATKTFTATAVGFARQDGLLDLDDPILKYFRDDVIPQDASPLLEKVTIRHLLTMSSGISDGNYNFDLSQKEPMLFYYS